MKYFQKIIGERLYLSPICVDDVEIYTKWLNDYSVSGNLNNYKRLISLKNEETRLEKMACEGQNYAIVLSENDELIGNIGFMDIDNISRIAMIGLFIGEKENRGKGYGTEALNLMVNYGFNTLNLNNIILLVNSDNEQGLASYKKVGFKEFGRRREATYKNGKYIDVVYMDILKREFNHTKSI